MQTALDVPEVDVEELLALAEVLDDLVKLDAWIGEALRRRAAANCAAASSRLPKKTQRERLHLQLKPCIGESTSSLKRRMPSKTG